VLVCVRSWDDVPAPFRPAPQASPENR